MLMVQPFYARYFDKFTVGGEVIAVDKYAGLRKSPRQTA
jgi:hypothetical protein